MTSCKKRFVLTQCILSKFKTEIKCRVCKKVLVVNEEICSNGSRYRKHYCIMCAEKVHVL